MGPHHPKRQAELASNRPQIAVYNAYWSTAGGGESYAGGIAEVLRHDADVTLLSHEAFDVAALAERLALNLDGVSVRVIDECASLERASADFDVLFNASYRSHGRNGARRGVCIVYFPDEPGGGAAQWQRQAMALGNRFFGSSAPGVTLGDGFHPPDLVRWQEVRWTDGRGVLTFDPEAAGTCRLHLWIGRFVDKGEERQLEIAIDGHVVRTVTLKRPRTKFGLLEPLRITIEIPDGSDIHTVELFSEASRPGGPDGNGDRRQLGVPLVGVTTGHRISSPLLGRVSVLRSELLDTSWLQSYDTIVSISAFTERWVAKWWNVESIVIEPPVAMRQAGEKKNIILAVGRFFAPGRGHSKKQLEMVEQFGRLVGGGLRDWELHLVGGCSPDDVRYLNQVRLAAEGLPVSIHVDATGSELDELYASASIFWHATGLGEDLETDPVRAEHFGMTTVEAMSAGGVPVVFDAGGQSDIVSDGVDGFLFNTPDRWMSATLALIETPSLRVEFAVKAQKKATTYSRAEFALQVSEILKPS